MKILIATDGTPWSHDAIREAARLLPLTTAEVHVVSVANLVPLMTGYESTAVAALVVERELAAAQADVRQALALLDELGIAGKGHERDGDATHEILALGHELRPDLLVLGAHGKNALERLFLGSTSDAVIHRWPGAVLIVRPRS